MKKIIFGIITAVLLSLGLSATGNVVKADNMVQSIDASHVAKYDEDGNIRSANTLEIMKSVNVYQLKNGQFVKTDATLAVGSEWLDGVQVTTDDSKVFYQISSDQYITGDLGDIAVGFIVYLPIVANS
ncbi:hypothetical protein [Companilactobacillus metriopterae]|uniref:hypothetical protein n=1 Tax=Companilactobacillus metriopterae TaxID=1909267 RepID=UPI00100C29AA|nr:hypothetical protein [Companilactobacillus metriopterae]